MKVKNPFKKQGIMTTMVNTLIGGAGNVAANYVISQIDALSTVDANYIAGGKIVAGALIGSMSSNKYVHALADGMAVVGASELVSSLIASDPTSGLVSNGTIGRAHAGDPYFKSNRGKGFTVSGAFLGK